MPEAAVEIDDDEPLLMLRNFAGHYVQLNLADIKAAYGCKSGCNVIYYEDGKYHQSHLSHPINWLVQHLHSKKFIRVHDSLAVHIGFIKEYHRGKSYITLKNGDGHAVGKAYRKSLNKLFTFIS